MPVTTATAAATVAQASDQDIAQAIVKAIEAAEQPELPTNTESC